MHTVTFRYHNMTAYLLTYTILLYHNTHICWILAEFYLEKWIILFFCSANLSPYYIPKKLGSLPPVDYICSKHGESGMRYCSGLPRYEYEGIKCNASARPFSNNTPSNDSCVNWNQYYTNCTAGDKNPFQGGVSFDNIGLAWVAIFQVQS